MTVTINDEYGIRTYEDVVAVDFIDKENCENIAGRQLSENELKKIRFAILPLPFLPQSEELALIVNEITNGLNSEVV